MTSTALSMKVRFNFDTMQWENITVAQVKVWERLYPDVDVADEIGLKMVRWLDDKKDTKKAHKKNWRSFITKWLKREQIKAVL